MILVDLKKKTQKLLDSSESYKFFRASWSHDGQWVTYAHSKGLCSSIRIVNVKTGKIIEATKPFYNDSEPLFDKEGKYIVFKSARTLNPVTDSVSGDYNFCLGGEIYLILLQKDELSPFVPSPRAPGKPWDDLISLPEDTDTKDKKKKAKGKGSEIKAVKIDVEGIQERTVSFPLSVSKYGQFSMLSGGKLLYTTQGLSGRLNESWSSAESPSNKTLHMYNIHEQKQETLINSLSWYDISADGETLGYYADGKIRLLKAGDKADDKTASSGPSRTSGWIDVSRIKLSVNPTAEWYQMFDTTWQLQKEHFWVEDMSLIDWDSIKNQYRPLVARVGSRGELSDLLWEMQGELGTSHAYEIGGDYRKPPHYPIGLLGADFKWDEKAQGYKIMHLVSGDCWDKSKSSPLLAPGLNISTGDVIKTINTITLTKEVSPGQLLLNLANQDVTIGIVDGKPKKSKKSVKSSKDVSSIRQITVTTMFNDAMARYREWVESNRARIHKSSDGKIGYIHVPDCGPFGYSEFHRSFLTEVDKDGLIIDVRFNGGGNVSQKLMEKLRRRRIAWCTSRWGKPTSGPFNPAGPMAAITNECAGSDGDIFSHTFKMFGLGPLIGKRTWGGVIGISPSQFLLDGTITTQPEYSFWFNDVGWEVENYGTEPDIEVDIMPSDYKAGRDPQIDRAVKEVLQQIKENNPVYPDMINRPSLMRPTLPGAFDAKAKPTVKAKPTAKAKPTVKSKPTAKAKPTVKSKPTAKAKPTAKKKK
jgi:tricorn protease